MITLSIAGAYGASMTWLHYLSLIPEEQVPEHPFAHRLSFGAMGLLAIGGAALSPSVASVAFALIAVGCGATFEWLLTEAPVPDGDIQVHVGGPLLPFEVLDARGHPVRSEDLENRRLLIKFFRGSW